MSRRKSRRRKPRAADRRAPQPKPAPAPGLSWRKKLLFGLATAAVALTLWELVLWLVGVQPYYYRVDQYAGFSKHIPHFASSTDEDGRQWMTLVPAKEHVLNKQRFLAEKPPNTYRIVCGGGSTTYGRPFYDHTSWPGWIRALLPAADSSREWEVINVGAISYASYRAAGLMEEMAQYDPDLFIVYTGHNEFLERRTYERLAERPSWVTDAMALASRTRSATVIQKTLEFTGMRPEAVPTTEPQLGEEVKAIPINVVGPEAYHRDPALAKDVAQHFQTTLRRMAGIAKRADADILFVVPASNLLDYAPFKSQHRDGLNDSQRATWQQSLAKAGSLAAAGRHEPALDEIQRAADIDDQFAQLLYLQGRTLYELDRHAEAAQALLRARDEDICPLRATSPLVQILREVAAAGGIDAVDFEQIVREHSEFQLPGRAMFHDHVHPTVEANRLLAKAIVSKLQAAGIVVADDAWNEATIARVSERVMAEMDRPLCAKQLRALAAMMAAFGQLDQSQHQAELSLELSGRTAAALQELADGLSSQKAYGLAAEYHQEAIMLDPDSAAAHLGLGLCWMQTGRGQLAAEQLRAAVRLDPNLAHAHNVLGVWLAEQGQMADAEQHFLATVRLAPDQADAHSNLGLAIARQGRYREALPHYRRSLQLSPGYVSAHYNLGLALEQLGKHGEARAHYEEVLRQNPQHEGAKARLQAIIASPALPNTEH